MVKLDYAFDTEELEKRADFVYSKATGTDLDYYLFCGCIFFTADGVSFDTPWKWTPILDFCVRMGEVVDRLQRQRDAILEFTENEAVVDFKTRGSLVRITAEYARAVAEVPLAELAHAVRAMSTKLVGELAEHWPDLWESRDFRERLDVMLRT